VCWVIIRSRLLLVIRYIRLALYEVREVFYTRIYILLRGVGDIVSFCIYLDCSFVTCDCDTKFECRRSREGFINKFVDFPPYPGNSNYVSYFPSLSRTYFYAYGVNLLSFDSF